MDEDILLVNYAVVEKNKICRLERQILFDDYSDLSLFPSAFKHH